MEILDAEWQWDRRKLTFYYTADQRVDFRELVRELFRIWKTRVWLCVLSLSSPSLLSPCAAQMLMLFFLRAQVLPRPATAVVRPAVAPRLSARTSSRRPSLFPLSLSISPFPCAVPSIAVPRSVLQDLFRPSQPTLPP